MDIGGLDNTILTIGVSEGLIGGRDGPVGRVVKHSKSYSNQQG